MLARRFLRGTHGATLRAKATSATALHARDTAELQNLMRRQRKLASEAGKATAKRIPGSWEVACQSVPNVAH